MRRIILTSVLFIGIVHGIQAQEQESSSATYKKRVLESTEIDVLTSFYSQDGDNAAVAGGRGTEELKNYTSTVVVSVPISEDEVLTIDAGISIYTSASSSNINPFGQFGGDDDDEDHHAKSGASSAPKANPFNASSGASESDVWKSVTATYSHSSDDRNDVVTASMGVAAEYDYFSLNFGGSYTRLFNEQNTSFGVKSNVFIDKWKAIYPTELRSFEKGGSGLKHPYFKNRTITGNANYNPKFSKFDNENRRTYALGITFSQVLHQNLQFSVSSDYTYQDGLLSTPFQRVYFADVANSYIDQFQLADDVERLPSGRHKWAIGSRVHWFLNEYIVLRSFYRYYADQWGIKSNTASLELPLKLLDNITIYPSYRFYNQSAADYFRPYEKALSTERYYTSDFDLSKYKSDQYGFGVGYTDPFAETKVWRFGLKSVDVKAYKYDRDSSFGFYMITAGVKFVMD